MFIKWGAILNRRLELYLASLNIKKDPLDLVLMATRISTTFLTALLIAVLLGAQTNKNSDRIHVVRLDTSTIDIFSGLYTSLSSSISTDDKTEHYGEGLTTSQIIALTNYTSSLLSNAPDYISSSLYSTCSHYTLHWVYKNTDSRDPNTATSVSAFDPDGYDFENTTMTCYTTKLFDYRSLISSNNLDILLSIIQGEDDSNVLSDAHYQKYQEKNTTRLSHIPKLLILIAVMQIPIFILTIIFYNLRRSDQHDTATKLIGHVNAVITLIILVFAAYSVILMSVIFQQVRSRVHSEFSAFNISLHFGAAWFSLLWIIFATNTISMSCWVGPMWCSTPEGVSLDEENDNASLLTTRTPFTEEMSINIPSISNQFITDSRYPYEVDFKQSGNQSLIKSTVKAHVDNL